LQATASRHNSARPSGALVYGANDGAQFTDAQFNRLKGELEENFSGGGNAGRPLLLDGGLDWKALSLSPKDMDFIEAKAAAAREIALCFGVPPLVLGLPGDNTRANYQEANSAFWRSAVIPMVARLQRSFEHWLKPAWPKLRIDYDVDRIDALSAERAAEWARVDAATFLTTDEKRAALGFGKGRGAATLASTGKRGPGLERRYAPDQPRDDLGR
jgi:HK97 family phage portal protein